MVKKTNDHFNSLKNYLISLISIPGFRRPKRLEKNKVLQEKQRNGSRLGIGTKVIGQNPGMDCAPIV